MTLQITLLNLTNAARITARVPLLQSNSLLQWVAQQHAEEMARTGYFDHIDGHGRDIGMRLLAAGYNYRWCGENISAGKQNPDDVIQWWLSSPGHRDNMLKAEFTEVGFGYCYIEHDRNAFHHYWVQVLAVALPP